ncbi:MAG TPA: DUF5996 family protein [Patescibacteria group bacterium]|nr:DUF5996 family protein [Patescibacteria group bacterium]
MNASTTAAWPPLPLDEWRATRDTLHMWTQIAGKIRMAHSPLVNHWWNVTLYVSPRGLTTSAIASPGGLFEIRFDFIDHQLVVETSAGAARRMALGPCSVADFYADLMALLDSLGIERKIHPRPDEVPDPIPFDEDRLHRSYDPEQARRFWCVLVSIEPVFQEFRGQFVGKCSPVHFFWGAFDLAVTRFSGRRAPERPGADAMTREGYSHECSSAGFWTGGAAGVDEPVFYAYMAPEPAGYRDARISPGSAFYHKDLGEFLLRYEDVRQARSPRDTLLSFMESAYEAGANLAQWDRAALERGGAAG